jgi:Protein of unknown function (DUF2971)
LESVANVAQPPLYKYLDVQGATLSLRDKTFKHSKPSYLNDTEDLTIKSIFPETDEEAVKILNAGLSDIILRNLNKTPTVENPTQRSDILKMQAAYRIYPKAAEIVKKSMVENPVHTLEAMRARNAAFVNEINDFMQGYRVLCVTTLIDSKRMWDRYAQNGEGFALRIVPNVQKNSKFELFKPVNYAVARPALFEGAEAFLEGGIFGDAKQIREQALHRVTYTKTLEWEYESEYRLVIPVVGEADWSLMPYHPEEIAELYLGFNVSPESKKEILGLAIALNPHIQVFDTVLHDDGRVSIKRARDY